MGRGLIGGVFVSIAAAITIAVGVSAEQPSPARDNVYVVQLAGPVLDAWKAAIVAEGAELLDYVPQFAFRARMAGNVAARVRQLPFVSSVRPANATETFSPRLARNGSRPYVVRLERGADATAVEAALRAAGVRVIRRGSAILVLADGSQLDGVAAVDGVAAISNFVPRIKHNEFGGGVIVGGNAANASGYDGSTQTIAIADTGLGMGTAATAHPGIAPARIVSIANWPGTPDFCFETIAADGARDVDSGHGTHVATTALGAGNGAGVGRGTAPAANLFFQAIEDYAVPSFVCNFLYGLFDGYYLVGLPGDIGDLFLEGYQAGARVHSNSWGAEVAGEYTQDSANADAFIWSHRDLAVTFSAGNSGVDADLDGEVDLESVNAPGTAKNVITIGASENDRQSHWECDPALTYSGCALQGGQNDIFTWGAAWPDRFQTNPLRDDPSAGNAEQLAAFSSRGPTMDGRIKPDVVAPGTWMLSGYSDAFQQQYDASPNPVNGLYQYDGWGYPADASYKYMGGTSMSAPLVAGGAAVVRDFYQKARGHNASAALVKAALVNTAVDLLDENNDGALDNAYPIPNMHEGWGRIDLVNATDGSDQFSDETTPLSTGGSTSLTFPVATPGNPFKVTLAWTDYPASTTASISLVNDLDLTVTAPDGTTYRGNVFDSGWSVPNGAADRLNNLENVYVFAATAGTWTVTVSGYNVPNGPQPFALVVDQPAGGSTQPVVRVTVDDATATEAGPTHGAVRFTRSGDPSAALDVTYQVSGTATAGSDYVALSGSITFPADATTVTLAVEALDDLVFENPEQVIVALTASPGYVVGSPSSGTVTLSSDDLPPDLSVPSATGPGYAAAGTSVTVTDTTRNAGGGPAPASETGYYLSDNNTVSPDDVFLGSRSVPALAAGAVATGSLSIEIPASTEPGTYRLLAKADWSGAVDESSEVNNVRFAGYLYVGPDLLVSVLTAPSTAAAGQVIQVSNTTKNGGAADAPATTTTFYLSTNTTLDGADQFLGTRPIGALAGNGLDAASTPLTIPAATAAGAFYVLAQADSAGVVAEFSETNNVKASGVVRIGADLTVSVLTAPPAAAAGETIGVGETTANTGAGDADESTTSFYLSSNTTWEASDTFLTSRAVSFLAAGTSEAATVPVTVPAATATGTYYVLAKADAANAIAETYENNNVKSVKVTVGPDLTVTALEAPSQGGAGEPITLTDSTRNAAGVAVATVTAYYLSTNTTLDANDILLGTRAVPALLAGETSSSTQPFVVPANTATGTYRVLAQADHGGAVIEVSETNNVKYSSSVVSIGPDLSVTKLTPPAIIVRGTTVAVTDWTANLGGATVASTTTSYYLSVNSTLDASDLLVGSRTTGTLLPGATDIGQGQVTIPAGQATGNYYLIAKVDPANAVAELSESNNTKAASVKINP